MYFFRCGHNEAVFFQSQSSKADVSLTKLFNYFIDTYLFIYSYIFLLWRFQNDLFSYFFHFFSIWDSTMYVLQATAIISGLNKVTSFLSHEYKLCMSCLRKLWNRFGGYCWNAISLYKLKLSGEIMKYLWRVLAENCYFDGWKESIHYTVI